MVRRYLVLALVAFGSYSLVAPLIKVATRTVPSTTAVFISNFVMLVLIGAFMAYRGTSPTPYLRHEMTPYVLVWGTLLAVGLLSYYHAISLGPVSVVVPIYGLFIAVSSLIGVVALGEEVTLRKVAGIGFAVLAVALMSV